MNTRNLFRAAAFTLGLGVTVAAHAVSIHVESVGSYVLSGPGVATFTEDVTYQKTTPHLGPFTSVEYTYTLGHTGTAIYKNATDTQELDVSLSYNGQSNSGTFFAFPATWVYTGGKGDYAGFASGHGTFTANLDTTDQSSFGTLKGSLDAVPEPSAFAALGLGLIALVRRRRA